MQSVLLFDFNASSPIDEWQIVDDVVMGGRSNGSFELNQEGHGVFSGNVSLENNGGFSSVRYHASPIGVTGESIVKIHLKGDGKSYQFRVKHDSGTYYSYITSFQTSGEWEIIEIPLKDLYPSFRGRRLTGSNFAHGSIEEIAFLIGNKRSESFKLLIDKIELASK